jgi:hypothetical protein
MHAALLIDLASDVGLLLSKEVRETEGERTSALVGATHTHGEKHDTQPRGVAAEVKKFARFFDVHSNISGVRPDAWKDGGCVAPRPGNSSACMHLHLQ